jgi:hypothetical protein
MTALSRLPIADRLLAVLILALSLAVAAEAHAFCSVVCIHGDRMVGSDICSSRS